MPNSYDLNAEYGPSLFDYRHLFNANWVYQLPFGEGRRFGADHRRPAGYADLRLVHGRRRPDDQRGTADRRSVHASVGWRHQLRLQLRRHSHGPDRDGTYDGVSGSNGIGTASTGLNIFADPAAAFRAVRPVRLSEDVTSGRGALRGLPFRQVDLTFGKATRLTDQVTLRIGIDLVNAFNTVNFTDPTVDLRTPTSFGVVSQQRIDEAASIFPRRIQLSGRIEF